MYASEDSTRNLHNSRGIPAPEDDGYQAFPEQTQPGDVPDMTSANMIVLLLMPALIVAIFMICLIYLSGCRCKLGSQKGYRTNKNFQAEDKCVICLRRLDTDLHSDTLSSVESCSLFNQSTPNEHGSTTHHGSTNQGSATNAELDTIPVSGSGAGKIRSISWSSVYKQKLFSGKSVPGATRKQKRQRVVRMKNCPHSYHNDCIKQWMKANNSCPLCKTKVNSRLLLTFHPQSSPYFSIVTV